jgi:4-amino-4-deoxy-L-arabinose transferase-like glycosyltransferase
MDLTVTETPTAAAPDATSEVPNGSAAPEQPAQPARTRFTRWLPIGLVALFVVMIVLRFLTRSPLWLDEAQTVTIAHRSIPHLFSALREDGSPPLYYLLLHYWMSAFGTSSFAIRALSGIFAVAAIPVMALVARRYRLIGSSPWPAVLLLVTSPFAVRYATEARMYSLLVLLVLLAMLAYERLWTVGGVWPFVWSALVTSALLLTHYWSMFLLAVVGGIALVLTIRGDRRARRVLIAMAVGALAFIPWLPSFAYQSAHTGAPWGSTPGAEVPLLAIGSWVITGPTAPLLRWAYYLLVVAALIGYTVPNRWFSIGRPVRRRPLVLLCVCLATMIVAVIASDIAGNAYAPRYTNLILAPMLLVIAAGIDTFPARARNASIPIVCGLGLVSAALIPNQLRTQAGQVAAVLKAAKPSDLVVFCPDELGPAVHRIAPNAGTQVVYPTFGSADMVDWVNYAQRNETANPIAFARTALQRAQGHTIWYVYKDGYPTMSGGCESLVTSFTVARGAPVQALEPHGAFEEDGIAEFTPRSPGS